MFTAITLITLAVGIAPTAHLQCPQRRAAQTTALSQSRSARRSVGNRAGTRHEGNQRLAVTYFTFREENRTFQDTGVWRHDSVSVTGIGEPEQVDALFVTDGTLPILGIQPIRGRWFTRKDDSPGSPETVMLAYGYWQRKFGADPSVIGRRMMIDSTAREIIGIMPRSFSFMSRTPALILPFQLNRSKTSSAISATWELRASRPPLLSRKPTPMLRVCSP